MNVTPTTDSAHPAGHEPASLPGPAGPPGFTYDSETFQHYQVLRRADGSLWELGRGAMGVTYKAFDTNLRCEVALKVISAQHLHSEVAGQRFIREARVAARLRHRNIATVYHLGVDPQGFFYSMEFIDGETLEDLVGRVGSLSLEVVLRIALQTARALAAASRQGLIHRDIKPANLMVLHQDEDGEDQLLVKVIDFGLARSYAADDSNAQLTATGFVGTPLYASPEQLEEKDLDVRSDIYSLGITLWILLTGRPPFDGKMTQVITQHLHAEPPWWQLGDCPEPMRALLERMLCKDAAQRYQSAGDLRLAVEACLRHVTGKDGLSTELPDLAGSEQGPLSVKGLKPDAAMTETAFHGDDPLMSRARDMTAGRAGPEARPTKLGAVPLLRVKTRGRRPGIADAWRLPRRRFSLAGAALAFLCALGLVSWRGWHGSPGAKRPATTRPVLRSVALQATAAAETLPVPTASEPPAAASPGGRPGTLGAEPPSFLLSETGGTAGVPRADPAAVSPPEDAPGSISADSKPENLVGVGESPVSVAAAMSAAGQSASPTPDDKDDRPDDGGPNTPVKAQAKTSQRSRSHHNGKSAPTPAPSFFQKLFGIKPKPHSS